MSDHSALVLFSGGQDSAVCLAWALERFQHVETVGFDFGQRHSVELTQRLVVRDKISSNFPGWSAQLGDDHIIALNELSQLGETALTHDVAIAMTDAGLPSTFVPGRNLLFFVYSAALAYRRDITTLIGGMCETDFSGYPDCRDQTIRSLETTISLGIAKDYHLKTPLMFLSKAETWALSAELGGSDLIEIILEDTHTCYLGDRSQRHQWGYGCGTCPACELRANGFETWRATPNAQTRLTSG